MNQIGNLLLLVFLLGTTFVYGQKSTFITYEIGITKDVVNFSNPQGNVYFYNDLNGVPGFLVTQQLNNYLFIESGIYIDFIGFDLITSSTNDTTYLMFAQEEYHVPIRMRLQKSIFNDHVAVFISNGITLAFVRKGYPYYSYYSSSGVTTLTTNTFSYSNSYALIDIVTGMDIRLAKNFFMGIRYRYCTGFKNCITIDAVTANSTSMEIANYHFDFKRWLSFIYVESFL